MTEPCCALDAGGYACGCTRSYGGPDPLCESHASRTIDFEQMVVDDVVKQLTAPPTSREPDACVGCGAEGTVELENEHGATGEYACVYCVHRWQSIEPGDKPTSDLDVRIRAAQPETEEHAFERPGYSWP